METRPESPWQFAEAWEAIAAAQPGHPAFIQGSRIVTWAEFDGRADALAQWILDAGLEHGSNIGVYLHNSPEFMTVVHGAFKVGCTPFNVNYRYGAEELFYLFENADCRAAVFGTEFSETLEKIRHRLPGIRWIGIPAPGHPVPAWASDWNEITADPPQRTVAGPWGRSEDDLLMLYTGGTTGLPKGVMWRHGDLWGVMAYGGNAFLGQPPLPNARAAGEHAQANGRPISMMACPLMHGTGLVSAIGGLIAGGTVTYLRSRTFNAEELLDEVDRLQISRITLAGMGFCTPLLETLEESPGKWDLSAVRMITSSGAMWSQENKHGILNHMPGAILADVLGSSEAIGLGISLATRDNAAPTAKFLIGEHCAVFNEEGRRVVPGSGESGRLAVGGFLPLGYHKDEAKTAATFQTFEGRRWSMPGDWATVNADGTLNLLGRGSQCINTGGEKVYPEEVEECLKRHPAVRDAAVVGLPDPRFGERVCALVEASANAPRPTEAELAQHVRTHLAPYKTPRTVRFVTSVNRAPNGKLDYRSLKTIAQELTAAKAGDS